LVNCLRLSLCSNYVSKGLIFTAPWGAPVFPIHQSALLGQGLLWRSLGRSLPANFNACAARPAGGWVGAAASRRVLTASIYNHKRTVFNKRVRPLPASNK